MHEILPECRSEPEKSSTAGSMGGGYWNSSTAARSTTVRDSRLVDYLAIRVHSWLALSISVLAVDQMSVQSLWNLTAANLPIAVRGAD